MIKKGILGGTFNPVHVGHLHLAQVALKVLELDQLLFIPSYSPPHKAVTGLCPFHHRLAMLEIAVAPYPEFSVSPLEAFRDGYSYTIDTLRQLAGESGEKEQLFFLMGFDAFVEMGSWKEYQRIPEYATLAVCQRDGNDIAMVAQQLFGAVASHVQQFDVPEKLVSSSDVRMTLIESGGADQAFLPPGVWDYIEEHALFRG
ncbi:MAG: nicotinate-nucleotide adenylyltransferase [Spirochaetales bacterium]|nr:nicotinate-nucleotide adenylyltransferase [Spirochaetales bacterium]